MQIKINANDGSMIYEGDIEDMPEYGYYVDIYEEAVNQGKEKGLTLNGWTWEVT